MDIKDAVYRIKKCLTKEDRSDVEFRALLALTELGDIAKYITHDQELNPDSRPHGTKKDEELAYGQVLIQVIATMILRGIDFEKSLESGIENWEDSDWRKRKDVSQSEKEVLGLSVVPAKLKGKAYVFSKENLITDMPNGAILIVSSMKPDMICYFKKASAVIADNGGLTSHEAIIAREFEIPCIVGTLNATQKIPHSSFIRLETIDGKGVIKILEDY